MLQSSQFTVDCVVLSENLKNIVDEVAEQHANVDDHNELIKVFPGIGREDVAISNCRDRSNGPVERV